MPPQLAEQWQRELKEKFHIKAELVLSSTAPRLERNLRAGQSVFDRYNFTVVSTDFIKSEKRRHEFLRQHRISSLWTRRIRWCMRWIGVVAGISA